MPTRRWRCWCDCSVRRFHFPRMRVGQALIFPGDGGGHVHGAPGVFHSSAWATLGERQSFDVRELMVPHAVPASDQPASDASDCVAHSMSEAQERVEQQVSEWQMQLQLIARVPGDSTRSMPATQGPVTSTDALQGMHSDAPICNPHAHPFTGPSDFTNVVRSEHRWPKPHGSPFRPSSDPTMGSE